MSDEMPQPHEDPLELRGIGARPHRLMGVAGVVLGLVVGCFGILLPGREAARTANWQAVDCTIVSSQVVEEVRSEPWGNNQRDVTYFRPAVRFAYDYDGEPYVSEQLQLGAVESRDSDRSQSLVDRFAPDASATAYVNPDDPAESILLRPEPGMRPYAFGVGGSILALFGLAILLRR